MFNLSVILTDSAHRFADKTAYHFGDRAFTFAQINAAANQIASGLRTRGIKPGDKVALSCPNLPYFPMAYFGILKAGAVVVPLSVLLKKDEIAYHLQDSDAVAYLCFEGSSELPMGEMGFAGFQQASECRHFVLMTADPAAKSPYPDTMALGQLMSGQSPHFEDHPTQAEDTAVIIYTSGTTGRPKGAELTHINLLLNANLSTGLGDLHSEDIGLITLPLFHIFAMTVLMNTALLKGVTSVLVPRFDPEAVKSLFIKHKVTVFAGVPTMYWALLNSPVTESEVKAIASHLRLCLSGGASLPVEVMKGFEQKFQVPILEGYGMSEGSPVVTFNHLGEERKPGSIGKPVWGVEVKVVDHHDEEVPIGEKGELLYRGHNVMKGYYKRPEVNKEVLRGGWMHSGDVAVKDEDGYFYIVDRTKDMIIRGGLNVYPREVEELIIQHESVSLVAVIGIPHDQYGEEIKAFVVTEKGKELSADELIAWTRERLASYKYPRLIEFVEALPMSATGKILKKELRKLEVKP